MPCDGLYAEESRQRRLKALDDAIVRRNANIVKNLVTGELTIKGGDLGDLKDSCVLAWLAAHGSYEARLALQAAGANLNALAAIHAAGR